MKLTPSILVAELSGSSAGVTASRWKGRPYFRARVTPANPNTEDQQAQRAHLRKAVNYWQALTGTRPDIRSPWETGIKMFLDTLGAPLSLSGYNVSTRQTVKDLVAEVRPRVIPLSADRLPVGVFQASSGAEGKIVATWSLGAVPETDKVHIFIGASTIAQDNPDTIVEAAESPIAANLEGITLEDLTPDAYYALLAITGDDTDYVYSVGQWAFAQAGGA